MVPSRPGTQYQNNFENNDTSFKNSDEYLEKQIKHYTLEQGKVAQ